MFLADRGFADIDLMAELERFKWHHRIRIKGNFVIYRRGHRRCKVNKVPLACGQARFWHSVRITAQRFGPVHLALARPRGGTECWFVVSDEPTDLKPLTNMACALTSRKTSWTTSPMVSS